MSSRSLAEDVTGTLSGTLVSGEHRSSPDYLAKSEPVHQGRGHDPCRILVGKISEGKNCSYFI